MCLRDQVINNNDVSVRRVRWSCGIDDNDGGVGRGRVIDDASEGLEMMMEAARIRG